MRTILFGGLALALCSTIALAQSQPSPGQPSQSQSMQSQSMQGPTTRSRAAQNQAAPDQGSQAAAKSPQNAAVKSASRNNSSVPVAGANSFTERQARARIQARGYSQVGSLTKDKDGVWRGTAMKDGQQVAVSVDYQGNVN